MKTIFNTKQQTKPFLFKMGKYMMCFLFFTCSFSAMAQKKVSLVTQSPTTSIALPAGSKLDKRIISEVAGKALLQMEAKKLSANVTTIEILYIPAQAGYTADSLLKALTTNEWSVAVLETDNKYALLKKGNRSVLAYFEITKTEVNLYFGDINTTQPGMEGNNTTNPSNTVTTLPPAPPVQTTEQTTDQTTQQTTEQVQQQTQEPVPGLQHFPALDGIIEMDDAALLAEFLHQFRTVQLAAAERITDEQYPHALARLLDEQFQAGRCSGRFATTSPTEAIRTFWSAG